MAINLNSLTRQHILVVGDVMLDRYVWGEVTRISPEAPVPVVHIKRTTEVLGGAGNVAANLAGLGCRVSAAGLCGSDVASQALRRLLAEHRIHDGLQTDGQRPTITKTRIMVQRQQLLRLDEETTRLLTPEQHQGCLAHLSEALGSVAVVILSDYGKGFLQTGGLAQDIIGLCRQQGVPVLADPKGRDWERYTGADCVTPNTAELALAAGFDIGNDARLCQAARHLQERYGLKRILVTRGPLGMCLLDAEAPPIWIAARAREVFDVSGAGDTVVATLGAGLALGLDYHPAAELANTAAGIVVGKVGTQPVHRGELEQALLHQEALSRPNKNAKLLSWENARQRIGAWQQTRQRVVFTNGCFDLLHPGHVQLLYEARKLGDRLIVGLNSDISVRRLKGPRRPFLNATDRGAMLAALADVDAVVLFDEDTPLELITHLKPDVLVKGADYRPEDVVGRDVVTAYGGMVQVLPLLQGFSTSHLVRRIQQAG